MTTADQQPIAQLTTTETTALTSGQSFPWDTAGILNESFFTFDPVAHRLTFDVDGVYRLRGTLGNGAATTGSSGGAAALPVFRAEGVSHDINTGRNVTWNSVRENDAAFSWNGSTTVTVQESGRYMIYASADFTSTVARVNPNFYLRNGGNSVYYGALGRTGYIRSTSGHNASSLHATSVESFNSGATILVRSAGEAASDTIVPDRSQFFVLKLEGQSSGGGTSEVTPPPTWYFEENGATELPGRGSSAAGSHEVVVEATAGDYIETPVAGAVTPAPAVSSLLVERLRK